MTQNHPRFETTQWMIVWEAARESDSRARPALESIIQRYWMPLYHFARLRGLSPSDAEDATQEFLCGVIEGGLLKKADPARGKFRTYLLTAWKRFLIDEYRKQDAQKRGGRVATISIDLHNGEQLYQRSRNDVGHHPADPDSCYTTSWAMSVLQQAKQRLHTEYVGRGKETLWLFLSKFLTQPASAADYEEGSRATGQSSAALKVALHRLRQKFGDTLREIVLETIDDPSTLEDELQELLAACRNPSF